MVRLIPVFLLLFLFVPIAFSQDDGDENQPPVIVIDGPSELLLNGPPPYDITLDAGGSYDPDPDDSLSYRWSLGGVGVIGNPEPVLNHRFETAGDYRVTLRIVDQSDVRRYKSVDIRFADAGDENHPPVIVIDGPSELLLNGPPPYDITLDASGSYDPDPDDSLSYRWSLGGVGVIGNPEPVLNHRFETAGDYRVTLRIVDQSDVRRYKSVDIRLANDSPPVASFTMTPNPAVVGTGTRFDASASYDPDGDELTYSWDYGNGISNSGEISFTGHREPATLTVTLLVTDARGARSSLQQTLEVMPNQAPVANAGEDITVEGQPPYFVQLDGSQSSDYGDPNLWHVEFEWFLGNDRTTPIATGENPTISFDEPGQVSVALRVTDRYGEASDFDTVSINLIDNDNSPPVVDFTMTPNPAVVGTGTRFDASASYDPDGDELTYSWDYGNGISNSGEISFTGHREPATLTVTLLVTDARGARSSLQQTLEVMPNQAPVANAGEDITVEGQPPYFVQLDGSQSSDYGDPNLWHVEFEWFLGNDRTTPIATGENPTISFDEPGQVSVALRVTDRYGEASDFDTVSINLIDNDNSPPVVDFTMTPNPAVVGTGTRFDASASYDPDGDELTYSWDYGNGISNSGEISFTGHREPATLTVTLLVTDARGARSSLQQTLEVMPNQAPVANAGEDITVEGQPPYLVQLDGSQSSDYGDPNLWHVEFEWFLGNDRTTPIATGENPTISFDEPGQVSVALRVTDRYGEASDFDTVSINLIDNDDPSDPALPNAAFRVTGNLDGQDILFTPDIMIEEPRDYLNYEYAWDFGDGTTSDWHQPIHSYSTPGVYTARLVVTDALGNSDSTQQSVEVLENQRPIANAGPDITIEGTPPFYFQLDGSSSSDYEDEPFEFIEFAWFYDDNRNNIIETGMQPVMRIDEPGQYRLALRVMDSAAAVSDFDTVVVTLIEAEEEWVDDGNDPYRLHCRDMQILPICGRPTPTFEDVDNIVQQFMLDYDISGVSLGIAYGEKTLLRHSYGWRNQQETSPLPTDAMFRLASVSKPVTGDAIRHLASIGDISLEDKVFDVGQPGGGILNIGSYNGALGDVRIEDITVWHLLNHQAGWRRYGDSNEGALEYTSDYTWRERFVAEEMNVPSPATRSQIASYLLSKPLQFDPGTESSYSNLGYMLLGLVLEQASGRDFLAYIRNEIFEPIGVARHHVDRGRTFIGDHNPLEPFYDNDGGMTTNVFDPDGPQVLRPYGGWSLENHIAQGAVVANTYALLRFAHNRDVNRDQVIYGSHPGANTVVYRQGSVTTGFHIVILVNNRASDGEPGYTSTMLSLIRAELATMTEEELGID